MNRRQSSGPVWMDQGSFSKRSPGNQVMIVFKYPVIDHSRHRTVTEPAEIFDQQFSVAHDDPGKRFISDQRTAEASSDFAVLRFVETDKTGTRVHDGASEMTDLVNMRNPNE